MRLEAEAVQTFEPNFLNTFERPSIVARKIQREEVIHENSEIRLQFNVMPNKPVEEVFHVSEYVVGERVIEAKFDRSYFSSMEKSPSHVIFLTALVQCQKLLYILLCKEFGYTYDPTKPEVLKIWPTNLKIDISRMVRKSSDIRQTLKILSIKRVGDKQFQVKLESEVEGIIKIQVETPVFLIEE